MSTHHDNLRVDDAHGGRTRRNRVPRGAADDDDVDDFDACEMHSRAPPGEGARCGETRNPTHERTSLSRAVLNGFRCRRIPPCPATRTRTTTGGNEANAFRGPTARKRIILRRGSYRGNIGKSAPSPSPSPSSGFYSFPPERFVCASLNNDS